MASLRNESAARVENQPDPRLADLLLEAWDGLIYVVGPDLRIRFMNRHFIETIGRDATGEFCFRGLHNREEACPWCPTEVFSGTRVGGFFQQPLTGQWYRVTNIPLSQPDGTFGKVAFIHETPCPGEPMKELPVFRNIVDQLSDTICFHDAEDGRVLYANDLACSSLGYSREELLGMRLADFTTLPENFPSWPDIVNAFAKEETVAFEARHRPRQGAEIPVGIKATLTCAGLQRFVVTVARDISQWKAAEDRLIEERNKVEAIIAATGSAITVQDRDLRIIYQNENMIQRRGQHLGEFCYRVYGQQDNVCDECQALKCFEDGQIHHRPYTPKTAPGEKPKYVEIAACPLRDANGNIVACVEVVRDVTEQRKLEKSREEAFSAVSHEMRTPLTAVLGFAQYMRDNTTSAAEQQEYLGLILKEGERLKRLIDNLLSLQRLRAGFGLLNRDPVLVYPLLYEVAEHFRAPQYNHRIGIDCPADLPPVLGEVLKLQEAVTNLLDNAIKYSPQGSSIVMGAKHDGERVLIWVRDEGPGIPPSEKERIFERFYRLEGPNRSVGTGLGLALVEEIAHAHCGKAWVESTPGQGSTFYLSIPLVS